MDVKMIKEELEIKKVEESLDLESPFDFET